MRYSKQRKLILEIIRSTKIHPTAEWIFQEAKKSIPSIGIATVYRNLKVLTEAGEIRKVSTVDGVERYDGNIVRHYHFRCNECGGILDLETSDEEALEEMEKKILQTFTNVPEGAKVNITLLEGLCSKCCGKNKTEQDKLNG